MTAVLQNPYNFEVGTTVGHGVPAEYGVIKWMGILPDDHKMAYAGLEMVRNCTYDINSKHVG